MKKGYYWEIEKLTLENNNFRKVLYTTQNMQLVLMSLKSNEEIGSEVHPENDQFFRFEEGSGKVYVNDTIYEVEDWSAVIIPAWSKHNVVASEEWLKMYTIYTPAHHKDAVIHETKEIAEEAEERWDEEFDWVTTE